MIYITNISFKNELRPAQDLKFLLACIGEKVQIVTDFLFEDVTYCNDSNLIRIEPPASEVDLIDSTGVISLEDKSGFTDYLLGDRIGIYTGAAFTFVTLTEKLDNGLVRTDYGGGPIDLNPGDYIFNATPLAGVRYAWNLLESGNNFNSKIDGEYQQAEYGLADCTDLTVKDMDFTGLPTYQIGSVKLQGLGGTVAGAGLSQQKFRITHDTVITPFFLSEQWNDINQLIPVRPEYFEAANCLNYISQLKLGKSLNNPNGLQLLDIPIDLSNTGWFNEKCNGGKSNYSITSLVLKKGTEVIDALEFDADIEVKFRLTNTVETPFVNNTTKFIVGFNYLPEEETAYQNNARNLTTNFLFDSKLNTVGSADANGDNFGTSMQIIKTVSAAFVSTSSIDVTLIVNVGADAEAILKEGDFSRYMIWCISEKAALSDELTNKANTLVQVSEFYTQLTTIDLIDSETLFIQHPFDDRSNGETSLELFLVDDVVADTNFSIDFTGKETDGILITKIKQQLVLTHASEADIILEDFALNTSQYPLIGIVQNINFSQDRSFKIPNGIRKTITIERNFDLDSGNVYNWRISYPFMFRWEYWIALALQNVPAAIFDHTKPLDGLNQFWHRYNTIAGWSLNLRTVFEIEQNGEAFEQEFLSPLTSLDFNGSPLWTNTSIKSYNSDDVELANAGLKYIQGYQDVKIVASFEKTTGDVPDESDVGIVIWIEPYEGAGIDVIRMISSFQDVSPDSWFKSVDTSNRVVIDKTGSVFTGTCLVNYSKLPQNNKYKIYARLYDITNSCTVTGIQDNDGFCIQDNDGIQIEMN